MRLFVAGSCGRGGCLLGQLPLVRGGARSAKQKTMTMAMAEHDVSTSVNRKKKTRDPVVVLSRRGGSRCEGRGHVRRLPPIEL